MFRYSLRQLLPGKGGVLGMMLQLPDVCSPLKIVVILMAEL